MLITTINQIKQLNWFKFWYMFSIFIFINVLFSTSVACLYLKNNPIFNYIHINMFGWIISDGFVSFNDVPKIILYLCDRIIWSIRLIQLVTPFWDRYFKFIVICRLNIFLLELTSAIFLLGSLRSSLLTNDCLSLWGLAIFCIHKDRFHFYMNFIRLLYIDLLIFFEQ